MQRALETIFRCKTIRETSHDIINSVDMVVIPRQIAERVVSINVTGDYYEMLNILNKLERNTKKKTHFEKLYREEGTIVRKQ